MTHTYVKLGLSSEAYSEIREKLEAAGYHHAIHEDGVIDMHGLAIEEKDWNDEASQGK